MHMTWEMVVWICHEKDTTKLGRTHEVYPNLSSLGIATSKLDKAFRKLDI